MLKTLNDIVTNSIKIQRSEFICILYPVSDVDKVKEIISQHNNIYKDATHNCYGYIIGNKQDFQYYSDQGEPSGTAGKPILNTLLKHELTNVLAIVTRYYGGIKLGVRGLIDAYSEAVSMAILSSSLIDFVVLSSVFIQSDYSTLDNLKHLLKQYKVVFNPIEYTEIVKTELIFPEEHKQVVSAILDDISIKGHLIKENI
jgi:uncharacterized YigZ family protein